MTWAQSLREYRPAVSILGDSYSTFENYLSCDSNAVWYWNGKHENTDVTTVEQTWWHQLITKRVGDWIRTTLSLVLRCASQDTTVRTTPTARLSIVSNTSVAPILFSSSVPPTIVGPTPLSEILNMAIGQTRNFTLSALPWHVCSTV